MSPEEDQEQAAVTKATVLETLRQAIERLERAAGELETRAADSVTESEDWAALSDRVEQLSAAALALAEQSPASQTIAAPETTVTDDTEDETAAEVARETATPPTTAAKPAQPAPAAPVSAFARLQSWWTSLVARLRTVLPASLSDRLSDRALAGLVAGVAAIAILLVTLVLPSGQPSGSEVAESPATSAQPAPPLPAREPEAAPPAPAPESTPEPTPEPAPESEPKSSPPVAPSPVQKPARNLRLTPEQKLIAAIQEQVAEITNDYAEGLIRSIRANFVGDQLTIVVGDEWFELPAQRQNQLANEMLQRSRQLDFSKLEIDSLAGDRLARNPVVGNEMVIFQRS